MNKSAGLFPTIDRIVLECKAVGIREDDTPMSRVVMKRIKCNQRVPLAGSTDHHLILIHTGMAVEHVVMY